VQCSSKYLRMLGALASAAALLGGNDAASHPLLEIQPGKARPGDVILIRLRGVSSPPKGKLGTRELAFVPTRGGFWALAPLEVEQAPGELEVSINPASGGASGEEIAGTIIVIEPNFNRRELSVANRFINPSAKERRRLAQDQAAFERAYDQPAQPAMFTHNFRLPRQSTVTAHYGDLRLFNGAKEGQHYGVDLDGRMGAPVFAANDGKVVLARRCFASGNSVLIHHGAGLFTAYFHLSQMRVAVGQKVHQGEQIGAVGKTGRVTGPHLHWAAKVDKLYVDPESLLRLNFK
jgi:murein DD-endopeptidase MepM/ murein hydrolase activator NlpD